MNLKGSDTNSTWIDADEAPELTDEWFEAAHQYYQNTLVKRGSGCPPILESAESAHSMCYRDFQANV
ncbi:hypothetical protein [Halomonas sp. HAL1]|uniref:hypothetical protein n=1 Tax=Halomonas sp. HAL1 TaxID=550984 RepID=UPI00022D2F53|nr:hypothetical protein [Halomonas sp. HAL1]EHA16388.1 hypothetical protein HAL1_06070 [Halomonas sp. HAL1]WKV92770.1 hypothetical protein Q3Y66_18295 [Halomonas sp. HAL1]